MQDKSEIGLNKTTTWWHEDRMWKWHLKGVSEGLWGSSGTEVVKGRPFAGDALKKEGLQSQVWGVAQSCWEESKECWECQSWDILAGQGRCRSGGHLMSSVGSHTSFRYEDPVALERTDIEILLCVQLHSVDFKCEKLFGSNSFYGQQQRANTLNELWKATWVVSGVKNKDLKMSVTWSFGFYFTSILVRNVVISVAHVLAS